MIDVDKTGLQKISIKTSHEEESQAQKDEEANTQGKLTSDRCA